MNPTLKSEPAPPTAPHPHLKRTDSGETERPPSGQRPPATDPENDADAIENMSTEDEEDLGAAQQESEDEASDPSEQIDPFDWEGLQAQYHEAIAKVQGEEAGLMEEWGQLMEFFQVWEKAGHEQETDRTFSRLKTRIAYAEHAENSLENTRTHYVSVVKAFESALALLRNTGFRA